MKLWRSVLHHAGESPARLALGPVTYEGLKEAVTHTVRSFPDMSGKRVGLFLGNGPLFGIYDIALTLMGAVVVPLPGFFSIEQLNYLVADAVLNAVIVEKSCEESFRAIFASLDMIEADTAHLVSSNERDEGEELALAGIEPSTVVKIIYLLPRGGS